MESEEDKITRSSYDNLLEVYPEKAPIFLNNEFNKYLKSLQKPSKSHYTPLLEYMGVKILVDLTTVDGDFSKNSYNYRVLSSVIRKFVFYIKDLLPNRKPSFIITDLLKNPDTKHHSDEKTGGLYFSDSIFINSKRMDDEELYIHEYAHYIADQIPTQTEILLKKAYQDMIDMYYTTMKKGKGKSITPTIRSNMSKRLGFPEYGLMDSDEFFAIVIQFWKKFPNNKMTYKFKSLVKKVLIRL